MLVLLKFDRDYARNARMLVRLTEKNVKRKIIDLLLDNKDKEAFDLLIKRAEPYMHVPMGAEVPVIPDLVFTESPEKVSMD